MSRRLRIGLLSIAVGAFLAAGGPALAQAQTNVAYSAGTYFGTITQSLPRPYSGRINFIVGKGKLTRLALVFGVACQGIGWAQETDPVPTLAISIRPGGGFSYAGTIDGTQLQISGTIRGRSVVGSFLQTLWFGDAFCSMNGSGFFTASS